MTWVTFCIETSNKGIITKVHKDYVPICMEVSFVLLHTFDLLTCYVFLKYVLVDTSMIFILFSSLSLLDLNASLIPLIFLV